MIQRGETEGKGFCRIGQWISTSLFMLMLLAVSACPARMAVAGETVSVLEIGVLPYVGLNELLQAYGPLARYLEQETGRPVRIVTARDYPDFLARTARHEYPLLITASHFARLAQQDNGYVPLLRPLTDFHVLLLVRRDAAVHQVADLQQARIATPGLLAQSTMLGRLALHTLGLKLSPPHETGIRFVDAINHKNAMLAVIAGEADACVVSEGAFRHAREAEQQQLREIALPKQVKVKAIPVIYAASPLLPMVEREALNRLILHFVNDTPAGQGWIKGLKYDGLRPLNNMEMQAMDGEVHELRQLQGLPETGIRKAGPSGKQLPHRPKTPEKCRHQQC